MWINQPDSLHHLEKIENPPENDVPMTRTAKPPNRRTLKFHNPGVYASVLLHQLIVRDGRRVERQRNHEGSAATVGLFNVNPALVLLNNRSHNGQT